MRTDKLTLAETAHLARINGFTVKGSGRNFQVVRQSSRVKAWVGTLPECYSWLAGYTFDRHYPSERR